MARKLGYTHEATLRERLDEGDGTYGDAMIWTALPDGYARSPASQIEITAFDVIGRAIG